VLQRETLNWVIHCLGWGDLEVVDFRDAQVLLQNWPPPNIDVEVSTVPYYWGFVLLPRLRQARSNSLLVGCSTPKNILVRLPQVSWRRIEEGKRHGVLSETLEATFR
jgi:hypothetical protein